MGESKFLDYVVTASQLDRSLYLDRVQLLSPSPSGPILELQLALQRVLIGRHANREARSLGTPRNEHRLNQVLPELETSCSQSFDCIVWGIELSSEGAQNGAKCFPGDPSLDVEAVSEYRAHSVEPGQPIKRTEWFRIHKSPCRESVGPS